MKWSQFTLKYNEIFVFLSNLIMFFLSHIANKTTAVAGRIHRRRQKRSVHSSPTTV